ncbi:MAG TPA: SMP-30/gluconolactonase/LRE family protein [Burkholderiaceae bacterium]|nr:SMP-30/gluconolactonase/LRE family protein [Burkholderiaceae bacterium]
MSTPTARLPLPDRDLLGESPVWDVREGALYWVDTRSRLVKRWVEGGPVRSWATPSDVGSIALAAPGRLVLSLEDGFAWLDLASGSVERIAGVVHPKPAMRLNDGRTDREGRFVVGSMVLHRRDPDGALHRLEHDGRVTRLLDGIALANSTCFSPDGRTMYFADSLSGLVRAWDYGLDGRLSNERVFVDAHAHGSGPDGATVDADGCVLVALVMVGRLARFAPDGRLLRTLELPVPHPTCPCFGGPDLATLFVPSIRNTGNIVRSDRPEAGALVVVEGLGIRGLPETPYAGRPAPAARVQGDPE